MSDGTINYIGRSSDPASPTVGRYKWWHNALTGLPMYTDESGVSSAFGGTYGTEFSVVKKINTETNNTATYSTYLQTNINNVSYTTGTYKLEVQFSWGMSTSSNSFQGRVLVNGVQYGETLLKETKDTTDVNNEMFVEYFLPNELIQSGFGIEFQYSAEAGTATVYRSFISFKRVA